MAMDHSKEMAELMNSTGLQQAAGVVESAPPLYTSFLQQLGHHSISFPADATTVLPRDSTSTVQVYQKTMSPDIMRTVVPVKADIAPDIAEASDSSDVNPHKDLSESVAEKSDVLFSDTMIWCEDCRASKSGDCSDHPPLIIADKRLLSFARQTLPTQLTLAVTPDGRQSVVCRKAIKARTRFGPLLGKAVNPETTNQETNSYSFHIFRAKDSFTYLNIGDENMSNWMMFIRQAESYSEQNLVAYQHNGSIYYSLIKNITVGTELRVGYAESYAELMGVQTLRQRATIPPAEKKVVMRDGFPCDHCTVEFEDFEGLDGHVCVVETAKLAASEKGTRTRNKRKGKPQKLGSVPKTKITAGDRKGTKPTTHTKVGGRKKIGTVVNESPCEVCGVKFNTRRRLDIHMYAHTGEFPYKCEVIECSKSFNSKFKLDRHNLSHGSRRFSCTSCDKSFARKDNLQVHVAIHDSSRQMYKCDFEACSKQYSSKSSYRIHIALHKVEGGSLQCALCHKIYDNPENLTHHIKVHANSQKIKDITEKKFECSTCDKKFFVAKDRDRHLLTHTKEKRFECQICQMRFARSDHLKRHHIKVHKDGADKSVRSRRKTQVNTLTRTKELPDLSASELTKSIQQLIAETNMSMDNAALQGHTDMNVGNNGMHISTTLSGRSLTETITLQASGSGQRNNYTLQNTHNNVIKIPPPSSTSWHSITADNNQRYVLSSDNNVTADNQSLPRYYTITSDGQGATTTFLLPADNSQPQPLSLESLQRPAHNIYTVDSSHTLPSDGLSNDFTSDGMKVLSGLTPIFLNPDGSTTDNDFIPIVYHQPYSHNGQ